MLSAWLRVDANCYAPIFKVGKEIKQNNLWYCSYRELNLGIIKFSIMYNPVYYKGEKMKDNLVPPINSLRVLLDDNCPHCMLSETEFYDNGRNTEESAKLRREGKVKPLWECKLFEGTLGHRSCSLNEWRDCPLH